METRPRHVEHFELSEGKYPFRDWLLGLKDSPTRHRLEVRLRKLLMGNPGHARAVGEGVVELIEVFGPGFRIYVGEDGPTLVILLNGGAKGTQQKDINLAKAYWTIYKSRKGGRHHG